MMPGRSIIEWRSPSCARLPPRRLPVYAMHAPHGLVSLMFDTTEKIQSVCFGLEWFARACHATLLPWTVVDTVELLRKLSSERSLFMLPCRFGGSGIRTHEEA